MPVTQDILYGALLEVGAISPGESLPAYLQTFALTKLNRLIDQWAAKQFYVYANQFQNFTLVPNLNPHTIGVAQQSQSITAISASSGIVTITTDSSQVNGLYPATPVNVVGMTTNAGLNGKQFTLLTVSATSITFSYTGSVTSGAETGFLSVVGANLASPVPTWGVLGNRPTKIIAANLVQFQSNPPYNIPMNIRDSDWWASQRVQQLTSAYPTDMYYQPSWPNGFCYIWPVPTVAYPVQLEWWTQLTQFTLAETFSMPPGYWDAVVYSLAESMGPGLEKEISPTLAGLAAQARNTVTTLNSKAPRISTGGDGLPMSGANRSSFDWRSGFSINRLGR